MSKFNHETHTELSYEYSNTISENKIYLLPYCILDHAVVEIFLTQKKSFVIESDGAPIRYGKHCGTRIHLGTLYGKIDYNPKLIWNGREWLVSTYGTFIFAEIEINAEENK